MNIQIDIQSAARLIEQADALLIAAGAGIGIDSGLPDFRGADGFWNAYPALRSQQLAFTDMANPQAFEQHPELAWGFYGHRLQLYRETRPHAGFDLLLRWSAAKPGNSFVFTSNVDGQFQRAGFAEQQVHECHGSIHHLQCTADCGIGIWPGDAIQPDIDVDACRWLGALPECPECGALARPNILMFGDWQWDDQRCLQQQHRLSQWRSRNNNAVVIELGAGTSIPSVRYFSESSGLPVIRINPDEPHIADRHCSLPLPALPALQALDRQMQSNHQD